MSNVTIHDGLLRARAGLKPCSNCTNSTGRAAFWTPHYYQTFGPAAACCHEVSHEIDPYGTATVCLGMSLPRSNKDDTRNTLNSI